MEIPSTTSERVSQQNLRFEKLAGRFVRESALFPEREIAPGKKLGIIEAIENNDVVHYIGEDSDNRMLDAVHFLVAVYDELGKDAPDEQFITRTISQLREDF